MADRDDLRTLDIGMNLAVTCMVRALGMLAENQQRALSGLAPAYGEGEFADLINEHETHWNAVLARWQR